MRSSDLPHSVDHDDRTSTDYKLATNRDEFEAAFRLVYERYLHRGLALPNVRQMRITPYQISPAANVFVAINNGSVVSTLTLVEDGEHGLPMQSLFGHEISLLRSRGLRLAEVTSLAHGRTGERLSWEIAERLMALMAQFAAARNFDRLLITVCPQHSAFYRRIAFRPFGEVRSYAEVCGKPALPMQVDLAQLAVDHPALYHRFFSRPFPLRELVPYCKPSALVNRFRGIMNEIDGSTAHSVCGQAAYQKAG